MVDQFAKPQIEKLLQVFETVGVDVDDREGAALVHVHDHERGAGDGFLDPEGLAEPLHECRLARPQVTGEQEQVTGPRHGGQFGGEGPRVVGRLGVGGQHALAPASTRLARTRSARILEVTSPPPPCKAADGWNVGTSVAVP